jgi:biopolymer transport protein ExbB
MSLMNFLRAPSLALKLAAPLLAAVAIAAVVPTPVFAQAASAPAAEAAPAPAAPAPAAAAKPAVSEEAIDNPYGLEALWKQGDFVAKGTLIIMIIMSMGSWYIIFTKLFEQRSC